MAKRHRFYRFRVDFIVRDVPSGKFLASPVGPSSYTPHMVLARTFTSFAAASERCDPYSEEVIAAFQHTT